VIGEGFLSYKRFRWLWATLVFLLVATIIYILDAPPGGRNGGTVVGYLFGILATIATVWLMAYGLRKRSYSSNLGTVEGWLAAHVWIGVGLLALVPLHAGFSFGVNVHTLAYIAMILTIVSGIWGAANYAALSSKITEHRGAVKDSEVLERISELSQKIAELCKGKGDKFLALFNRYNFNLSPSLLTILRRDRIPVVDHLAASALILEFPNDERDAAIALLGMLDQKSDLARGLIEQARIKALLKIWLYLHVPCSFVLCVALAIHIFSVFFFW
jgi:hypothetical protein